MGSTTLECGCLYLLEVRADAPPLPCAELEAFLAPDERARLGRFRIERDRRCSLVARGLLRSLLGSILDRHPASLCFTSTRFGKPMLAGGPSFNVSHSGERVMIAIADEGRVGVDIEMVRETSDLDAIASRNFAATEVAELRSFAPEERRTAFFRAWTRKEAFLKALGGGLALPLDGFAVTLRAGEGGSLLRVDDPAENTERWSLRSVPCSAGAEAAIAWDRPAARVVTLEPLGAAPA